MTKPTGSAQALDVDQLLHLHNITKGIARHCEKQLRVYLDALAPLFRPRRVLGDYVEGAIRETVTGAEQNLSQLKDAYDRVCIRPFDLRRGLATPIDTISTQLQAHPWQYRYDIAAQKGRRAITVTAPLTWIISFPSTYTPTMMMDVLAGRQERDTESVRAFVVRALILNLMFQKLPALNAILEGLRYRVEVRKLAPFGDLPLVTVSAPVETIRPSDDLVDITSALSGGDAFQEIIDLQALGQLRDPLREQFAEILRQHGESL